MKKTNRIQKIVSLIISFICLLFFNSSCGLDVLYVIGSPFSVKSPNENSSWEDCFFEFRTNEISDNIVISGTDVYYSIYDNLETLKKDISYINNNENYTSSKDKLFSYKKFLKLTTNLYNENVLIPKEGIEVSRTVKIRLTDYQEDEAYSARILVNNTNLRGSVKRVVPIRSIPQKLTFNFGRDGSNDAKPLSTDEDANITSTSESGVYYVVLYALTVGFDSAYTPCYSEPTYLGYIKIDSESENN